MFLLTDIENIIFKEPILTLIILIFFIYTIIKALIVILRKCGLVSIEFEHLQVGLLLKMEKM